MITQSFSLHDLNILKREDFIQALTPLFEGPPWIVAEAWHTRPFQTRAELYTTLCTIMQQAPLEKQIALLRSHPDLVGRAALAGRLSSASTSEQASAGLDRLNPAEITMFTQLNRSYWDRFNFPFIICVRENKKQGILSGFATRMNNTREQEIALALQEVAKICALRLQDLVQE
ncbi:OHCU decarboxylase [Reticulibacter mediterranei]|uniref:2-oxo-4-hydroxy-4-carboxy-5-ureidoimidazoline decarboxylase n=1 Tax=Reticulibacter mediterranei TaxID=2778369 RepID=A0A8J3IJF5_9CHLR|nr:2-oxo-4-hydroxy-4-carboxy-5-ureidoimidazoline decarboxylase [Reticulibacter mediterranei]GHO96659.1 OHCU decarboxylase [Reticulibacter mediterranei]